MSASTGFKKKDSWQSKATLPPEDRLDADRDWDITLPSQMMKIQTPSPVDVLSLGFGWTGTFLKSELEARKVSFACTTREGVTGGSIKFDFDPQSKDAKQYARLPLAKTVVLIFPIMESSGHKTLIDLYNETHPEAFKSTQWIQLGSTSAFDDVGPVS